MRRKGTLTGIMFILAGAGLILNKLGYFQDIKLLNIFLGIILLYYAIKNMYKRNFGGVLFPLAFIGILFSKELGIGAITPWPLLGAALLGSIGLSLIFKPKKIYINGDFYFGEEVMNRMWIDDDGTAYMSVKFNSSVRYLSLADFKKAVAVSKFGDMKVYFDGSHIEDEAVFNADVKFGNMTLFVPREWFVVDQVDILFGDFKTVGNSYGDSGKKLIVTGEVKFGDLKVIYV